MAYGAARHVSMDGDAYGKACAFIPANLVPLQTRIAALMQMSAQHMESMGAALNSIGPTYQAADNRISAQLDALTHSRSGDRQA